MVVAARDRRVAIYPPGTTLATTLTAETTKQTAIGRSIVTDSAVALSSYYLPQPTDFPDERSGRDVASVPLDLVKVLGSTVVSYALYP